MGRDAALVAEISIRSGGNTKVDIKRFNVEMEVKNSGIELEVRSPNGKEHLGDLVLTKTRLTWCPRQTRPENGKKINWTEFIKMMEEIDN